MPLPHRGFRARALTPDTIETNQANRLKSEESTAMADSFSQQDVESNLQETFTKYKRANIDVTPSSVITADLGVDSLSVMEIVAELEDLYDLTFPDEELPNVKTVGDVTRLIVKSLELDGRLAK